MRAKCFRVWQMNGFDRSLYIIAQDRTEQPTKGDRVTEMIIVAGKLLVVSG